MHGLLRHLRISLRLYFRNTMAMVYGYLFPTIFLVAFWVLYRYDRVPLLRHMGELLTITALGGACFGLPTTMVSERERGVWRRYRLTPLPAWSLVASTTAARYVILLTAGLLQLAIALSVGMTLPRHPLDLWVAFTFVSFAFIGLGLVIAMLADNVPAVQALGQSIFLPMLVIGGIAVPLASLPAWAQHLSAFFPGRYAVDAIQACVGGDGLGPVWFSLLALALIGAAGCGAGAKLFRWDAGERFASRRGKGWVLVALAGWLAVGVLAEVQGRVGIPPRPAATVAQATAPQAAPTSPPPAPAAPQAAGAPSEAPRTTPPASPAPGSHAPAAPPTAPVPATKKKPEPPTQPAPSAPAIHNGPTSAPPAAASSAPSPTSAATPSSAPPTPGGLPSLGPATWQAVTMADITRDLVFDHLPSDDGIVTPIAPMYEQPSQAASDQLDYMRSALAEWAPGKVADPVQRVRNDLYVAAVTDVFQLEIERYVPLLVFAQIQRDVPKDQLVKILYWIAIHPYDGDDTAVNDLKSLGLEGTPGDIGEVRNRTGVYAVKLLGRVLGKITPK